MGRCDFWQSALGRIQQCSSFSKENLPQWTLVEKQKKDVFLGDSAKVEQKGICIPLHEYFSILPDPMWFLIL
jgi:hypothetical protein